MFFPYALRSVQQVYSMLLQQCPCTIDLLPLENTWFQSKLNEGFFITQYFKCPTEWQAGRQQHLSTASLTVMKAEKPLVWRAFWLKALSITWYNWSLAAFSSFSFHHLQCRQKKTFLKWKASYRIICLLMHDVKVLWLKCGQPVVFYLPIQSSERLSNKMLIKLSDPSDTQHSRQFRSKAGYPG
jgi:hypothetical protein